MAVRVVSGGVDSGCGVGPGKWKTPDGPETTLSCGNSVAGMDWTELA